MALAQESLELRDEKLFERLEADAMVYVGGSYGLGFGFRVSALGGYIGIMENQMETIGIIGYILGYIAGYILGLYWDNGKMQTTKICYIGLGQFLKGYPKP